MSPLYHILWVWARAGMCLYTARVSFHGREGVRTGAPTILACSHPNSFLDAVMMGVFHHRPVHFLARGDAFRKPRAARLLRSMGAIPIHRLSEGREHLHLNDETFRECISILKKGGAVLIFSEGLSEHGPGVRPLRKGTARLAWMAWHEDGLRDLVVQPVGFCYSSYAALPKRVAISYGQPMLAQDGPEAESPAHFYTAFNEVLHGRLAESVARSAAAQNRKSKAPWRWLLLPPAAIGFLLHFLYYAAATSFVRRKTRDTVFYDSVLFGVLLLTYPVYVVLFTVVAAAVSASAWGWVGIFILPATAWALKSWRAYAVGEKTAA